MNRPRKSRVALVTGATGFLGGYIAEDLAQNGWRVVGLGLRPESLVTRFSGHRYLSLDAGDIGLRALLESENPAVCVHCAGSASVPLSMTEPLHDFRKNAGMTAELLESLRVSTADCALVFLSSAAVYGAPSQLPIDEMCGNAPISSYGYHKMQAEQLCQEYSLLHGLKTASIRIFSAYGAGLRRQVLWDLCTKLLGREDVVLQGTGEESRDFVHARDVASAVRAVLEGGALHGEAYNVASGRETKIVALAQALASELGVERGIHFDGRLPSGMPSRWRGDISKIRSLNYNPVVTIEQGCREYSRWFLSTSDCREI